MERSRIALAFVLSLGVMLAWQYFFTPPAPDVKKSPDAAAAVASAPPAPAPAPISAAAAPAVPERTVTVETRLWKAVFSNRGGVVEKWILKELPSGRPLKAADAKSELNLVSLTAHQTDPNAKPAALGAPFTLHAADAGLTQALNDSNYAVNVTEDTLTVGDKEKKELAFTLQGANGLTVVKKYVFHGGEFFFDCTIDAQRDAAALPVSMRLGPNFGDQSVIDYDSYTHTPPQAVVYANGANFVSASSVKPQEPQTFSGAAWSALTDHYFALAFVPAQPSASVSLRNFQVDGLVNGKPGKRDYGAIDVPVTNGATSAVYIGPKDRTYLAGVNDYLKRERNVTADLRDLFNYGFMSFLVRPIIPVLDAMLKYFHGQTHNYGLAIILVTVVVNMFLFPLRWKSAVAFRKASVHAPRSKELMARAEELRKAKVKMDDPRMLQLQKEQMQLAKESLPVMGCLPILLQMPVFIAIYVYLQLSVDLRQAPFVAWMQDLSAPDPLHILPVVLCVTQIGQSYLMPQPPVEDPAMKLQRKIIVWVMPILFAAFFFWSAPSGLVVYWMAGNIVSIIQQLIINKLNPPLTPPPGQASPEKNDRKKDLKPRVA
jgi:YidC/Oxa1 family membrane protein insertase